MNRSSDQVVKCNTGFNNTGYGFSRQSDYKSAPLILSDVASFISNAFSYAVSSNNDIDAKPLV